MEGVVSSYENSPRTCRKRKACIKKGKKNLRLGLEPRIS
jgi:hypothetical protein